MLADREHGLLSKGESDDMAPIELEWWFNEWVERMKKRNERNSGNRGQQESILAQLGEIPGGSNFVRMGSEG